MPASSRRIGLVRAFETIFAAIRDDAAVPHLPFLRARRLADWPSHLVGDGGGVIYLMVDVSR